MYLHNMHLFKKKNEISKIRNNLNICTKKQENKKQSIKDS